jgi:hypothetical protein
MAPWIMLLATLCHDPEEGLGEQSPPRSALSGWGADCAPGLLVNRTVGAQPDSPADAAKPTIVVAHGINPFHPARHQEVAERYAEAIGRNWGAAFNVLAWDWNAATMRGVHPLRNRELAAEQGRDLGEALLRAGIDPGKLHLVGHSSGCVVVAAAARTIVERTGSPVRMLTLLDPASSQHELIFGVLGAGSSGTFVRHVWATGPSGFGGPALYANVADQSFPGHAGWRGFFVPGRLDHLEVVRWHIRQMAANPWSP